MSELSRISVQRLAQISETEPVHVIDVRTPREYREVHAEIAQNLPLDMLDANTLLVQRNAEEPLYVMCHSGSRSTKACEKLRSAGHQHIVNVEGGTQAWVDAQLPVVRGKKAISLERQVRIVAGGSVLVGTLLSLLHPFFLVIPGIMGAGLMFAGITDTCGMGMMLAKMPWNQAATDAACCTLEPKQLAAR